MNRWSKLRDKVKEGYEKGDYEGAYRENREVRDEEQELFDKMFERMSGDKVLDLGCGPGLPYDRFLADNGMDVTGVDIAEKHVKKARENVPEARIIQGDFFDLDFESEFDAVVSFYAIFHIPREEHRELFEMINHWMKEDGMLLITVPDTALDRHEGEIKGGDLVWSSYSVEKNKELLSEAGFELIDSYKEDWREETHNWILAQKK